MSHFESIQLLRLRSDDPEVRHAALLNLHPHDDLAEVHDLIPFLHDEEARIRRLAIRFLGELADVSALPALLDAVGDDDDEVSGLAQEALKEFRTRDSVECFL